MNSLPPALIHAARSCLLFSLLLAGCTVSATSESDIERTWRQALFVLPAAGGRPVTVARRSDRQVAQFGQRVLGGSVPTVLFMHGCTGIGNLAFLQFLAQNGLAVVAPDSFARHYRPLQCDPEKKSGGHNLFVYDFRSAELTFSLEHLEELRWIDPHNLFLIGASEGGVTAAQYRADVFNARVIVQWTCTGAHLVEGIDAPPQEPVLAIIRQDDPYYSELTTPGQQGDCGSYMLSRPGSQSYVLPINGESDGHDVLDDLSVANLILNFVRRNQNPPFAGPSD